MTTTILVAGGYGLVGGHVARHLRTAGFRGNLVLAGRNPDRAADLAASLKAQTRYLNTAEPDSALEAAGGVDLVVAALKDPRGALLEAALERNAAFVGITQSADTVAPMLFRARNKLPKKPVVTLGHWQAGVATNVGHYLARKFRSVHEVRLAALYDRKDPVGPMTTEDAGEFMSRALIRQDAQWRWVDARATARAVERGASPAFQAIPMSVLDVVSMAAITNARNVRFDIGIGDSLGTMQGGNASHDLYFELEGAGQGGEPLKVQAVLSNPNGQAHLTAVGILLAVQAILDLDPSQSAPCGWHLPETLIRPEQAVATVRQFGASLTELAAKC